MAALWLDAVRDSSTLFDFTAATSALPLAAGSIVSPKVVYGSCPPRWPTQSLVAWSDVARLGM